MHCACKPVLQWPQNLAWVTLLQTLCRHTLATVLPLRWRPPVLLWLDFSKP
jgi:hypothetical protein